MISFFNRKGKLYVQFVADGKKYQRSTKLDDTPKNRTLVRKEVFPKLQVKILNGEFGKSKEVEQDFKFYATKYKISKENLKTYRSSFGIVDNRLMPTFKDIPIKDIKRADVKKFADELSLTLSTHRVRTILNVLVAILDIAIDYEHILTNPALNIKLPKHKYTREMKPFTKDEINTLLTNADDWFKNMVALAFYTGMRQGEIIALTWNDIDFENKTINVSKRIKKGVIDKPKTKSSIRLVPMLDTLEPYLKHQFELCKKNMSLYVFYNPLTNNNFYDAEKLLPHWYKLLETSHISKRVFYNTRHTFITQALRSNKISILDIAQIVGHKNIDEITRTYAKYLPLEHLKIDRNISIFTDKTTDTKSKTTVL